MNTSFDNTDIPPLKPNTWLWQSIAITLCCSPLFGIIAIVNAVRVNSLYYDGDYEASLRASKRARLWLMVGLITGLIYFIVMTILTITGNLPNSMESLIERNQSIYNY